MADTTLGVAVIGTGFGQKIHIPGLQAHHRTKVVAVQHRDIAKAQQVADAHQIPHACATVEEIVALPDVQAVSISTPPFLHYEQAKIVLQAGKHLLLEKPTTLTVEEARVLQSIAHQTGAVTALDFEFRFVPAWMRLSELLAEGFVGQKRLIKIDWLVSGRADPNRPWNWYARKDQGGGALGAVGSHIFDYIAWLFGPVQRLSARLTTSIPTRPDPVTGTPQPVTADDTAMIALELADGTPVQVTLSAATYQGRGHWVEVYGDRGTLVLGSDHQTDYVHGFKLWAAPADEPLTEVEIPDRLQFPQVYPDGRLAPFIRVVDQWVKGIDEGRSLTPSLPEGIASQLLMDLTHQSNETGTWVNVPT
ncbi:MULTISPECIES: Gfo/Idh/MocA family oxidoreductase [unclassified Leptolyngbya]|uniref:Gfo/Idh/MocA family protein n=1 Tax=unclassified Leptolyngbya TaxID=2650499 RepID=UPI0016850AC2|nr:MULTISPECIES: Gfo/Idh/MocA family oxidoreductase [unclassified Leptolyngbya]MBD1910257.1 Gfo/Idh/MocA family oxidoreductase [Leptolyngbya sp. FACHB-8]MBD2156420.1 Gfo/Idh/MocA family oxidoreductase [Leptolyngbya sp. FACHB-16]